ncbi:MAG: RNA polymerase sigma-70 factor [Ignavibacteria bacterium]|nr:RNA polymerase sigma-70 factor [Ignavibacteria bacterium]
MSREKSYNLLFIDRIKSGDEEAFKEFFFDHYNDVFRFIYRMTHNREVAKDLTQDTFLNFYNSLNKLNSSIPPNYYLFRIARNLTLNFLTRKELVSNFDPDDENSINAFFENPENDYTYNFVEDDIKKAIETLPNRCRAVFVLSRYHNLSYQEISETLEISLQTVKNQINKAIAILRKKLSHYLD